MKQLVDGEQMKALDYETIHFYGVPSLVLMERASLAVTEVLKSSFDTKKILIVCGSGNNGADGIAAARILHLEGYRVDVYLAGKKESFTEEAKTQWKIAEKYGVSVVNNLCPNEYTTIVDAVFGVGLSREITVSYRDVFEKINNSHVPVLAVDIPSGIHAATGCVMGIALQAVKTVTFAYGKAGLYLYPGASYSGEVVVKDIGIYGKKADAIHAIDERELAWLPKRRADGNKGTFGKVLIAAGSKNMSGAAYFSAKAALMTGAGMVKIFTEESNRMILQQLFPEAMLVTYGQEDDANTLKEKLCEAQNWSDLTVAGPGLGMSDASLQIMETLIKAQTVQPLVIDADGLNLLAKHPEFLKQCVRPYILTPHMGEMERLSGISISQLKAETRKCMSLFYERLSNVCKVSPVLVLKDARTMIMTGKDCFYLNLSGNSGMATAGSGDALSGMIAGLLAQGLEPERAAPLGVWLHGKAGDEAKMNKGERSMTASDLIESIPRLFMKLQL